MSDEASIRTPTYRVPRARGMDPATKRLALIAAALGSALFAVLGVWTVTGHHTGASSSVPVIEPPPGPMRVKPANPGGMRLAPGDEIFAQRSGADNATDALAPPPEIPDPQGLRPPPKPVAPLPAPAPQPPPAPAATALPPPPHAVVPPHAAPSVGATATAAAAAKPVETSPADHVWVQLAALPTEEAAKQQWTLLQRRLSDLLHSRGSAISKAEVDGHSWWRVRIGGFADLAAAHSFCDQVHAKGNPCDVLRP